jgi:hypothetical protein
MRIALTGFLLAAGGSACAGRVHPEDMSAAKHRGEAAKDDAAARAHFVAFDKAAERPAPVLIAVSTVPTTDRPLHSPFAVYDPPRYHLREAARHLAHARAHDAAAKSLEKFEDAECGAFSPAQREVCPLLGPIVAVEDIDGGVRVHFEGEISVAALVAHMRCHLAFARTRGYDVETPCALYVKGARVDPAPDGKAVDITADKKATVAAIRADARALATPPK